jgi:hypothetical protein
MHLRASVCGFRARPNRSAAGQTIRCNWNSILYHGLRRQQGGVSDATRFSNAVSDGTVEQYVTGRPVVFQRPLFASPYPPSKATAAQTRQPPKAHQAATPQSIFANICSTTRAPDSVRATSSGGFPSRIARFSRSHRFAFSASPKTSSANA